MAAKEPYICEPTDASTGRRATFVFLHGYGDDAEGLPLGLAQQFQFNSKLPYLRWILPNAPHDRDAMGQAWYTPKALPNTLKPRVPGHDDEMEKENKPDDEVGILRSVDQIDELVRKEIELGVPPDRIVVGGFSQGCAVSLVWGLVGRLRNSVAGVVLCSGYFPLADKIEALMKERKVEHAPKEKEGDKQWLYLHGNRDILVPQRLFWQGKDELEKYVSGDDLECHMYEGMGHSTTPAELRDMLTWLNKVLPG